MLAIAQAEQADCSGVRISFGIPACGVCLRPRDRFQAVAAMGVRRDKAALSSGWRAICVRLGIRLLSHRTIAIAPDFQAVANTLE